LPAVRGKPIAERGLHPDEGQEVLRSDPMFRFVEKSRRAARARVPRRKLRFLSRRKIGRGRQS
jgi:hypothetical protein